MLNPVETKVTAVYECQHRPLKEGETPKRKGQDTVFEATGNLTTKFIEKLTDESLTFEATIKHDGMCSKIEKDETTGKISVFRRYDVRPFKQRKIPENSVPAGVNPNSGVVDFYWIDITDKIHSPNEQYYQSTLIRDDQGSIVAIRMIVPIMGEGNCTYEMVEVPVEDIQTGTYELVGPKVQGNIYDMDEQDVVPGQLMSKGKLRDVEIAKHYFIKHGAFPVLDRAFGSIELCGLDDVREYIVNKQFEGIVFHFSDGSLFKVNRGHIGVEIEGKLKIC
eukprot:TRINITY_DN7428_c0_g1_i1.p1 TRINITY_DN7428_c0_g1~~TRINITY_DN7428_c0_g1_i1.p1  ORF type:complete len:278 (-),score=56.41 TRINITY_DN7428_c0_g1_i1:48-881(-)